MIQIKPGTTWYQLEEGHLSNEGHRVNQGAPFRITGVSQIDTIILCTGIEQLDGTIEIDEKHSGYCASKDEFNRLNTARGIIPYCPKNKRLKKLVNS